MQTKQIVGIVLGSAGVLISVGHVVLMMLFQIREPYHGFGTWLVLGLVLAIAGILLHRKNESK